MLGHLLLAFALLLPAAEVSRPWIGNAYRPGETVSYAHPFHHLKDDVYTVTLVDELGRETDIVGMAEKGDLWFLCPDLKPGFYEIAGAMDRRTGKVYIGHINGQQGFYIQSSR